MNAMSYINSVLTMIAIFFLKDIHSRVVRLEGIFFVTRKNHKEKLNELH